MLDISRFSSRYEVRVLHFSDVDDILILCQGNTQFYQYCEADPSIEQIKRDMSITPPEIDMSLKYYVGFYQEHGLVAVMDLIDGYPEPDAAYIGFFMMNKQLQGKQIGTAIIQELTAYLKKIGKTSIRLAIDKENPQSTQFWKKNGFFIIKEVDRNGWTILIAEKAL